MSNKELYKKTFSMIHASEDKVMEVIKMKENTKKRRFYGKKLFAIAACAACIMSVGIAANAATDGEIGKTIIGWFIDSDGKGTAIEGDWEYDENGNKIFKAELENGGNMVITENPDGSSKDITVDGDFNGDVYIEYKLDEEESSEQEKVYSQKNIYVVETNSNNNDTDSFLNDNEDISTTVKSNTEKE